MTTTVSELSLGEQLVLWAVRKRLEGERQVPALRGFRLADRDPHERDAYRAFEQLFGAVGRDCCRDLWFHRCGCGCGCGCGCVSGDEMTILGLVAAEQSGDIASALCFGRGWWRRRRSARSSRPRACSRWRSPSGASPCRSARCPRADDGSGRLH